MLHFHAYAYTGKAYRNGEIRKGTPPPGYPPIEIHHRNRPQAARLESLDEAMAWLEGELNQQLPVDAEAFPVEVRLEYSRSRLRQARGDEVIYGYWTQAQTFVSRQVFPCEGDDAHCRSADAPPAGVVP